VEPNIIYQLKVPALTLTYPIYIGEGFQDIYKDFFERYPKIAVITNDTIFNLYEEVICNLKIAFPKIFHVVIKDGEEHKNITILNEIYKQLIAERLGRDGLVVAFGGGVIGDLAGFASATFMRGIDFIQIPTTLLAMVDSSVGGKTGINLPEGKNMVGAFHQPQAVFCDLYFLDTLPMRQFNSGLMEIIKYGLILDGDLFDFIKKNKEKIKEKNRETIAYLVYRSCQLKSEIVAEDEKEKGIRSILNFGHTIGHALESYTDYQFYLHGEAVAIGSLVMIDYLVKGGALSSRFLIEFVDILSFFELPTSLPAHFDIEQIINHLWSDKKIRDGRVQWVILKRIGEPVTDQSINQNQIGEILRRLQGNG